MAQPMYAPMPMMAQAPQSGMKGWQIGLLVASVLAAAYYFLVYNKQVDLVPAGTVPNASGGSSSVLVPPTGSPSNVPPAPVVSSLSGSFYADDILRINLNGSQVYADNGPWDMKRSVNLPSVRSGDTVDFIVQNTGGPGGFIGTWTWNGKTYNTSAATFPGKVVPGFTWGGLGNAFPAAQWVWTPDNCDVCVNTFTWKAV